LIRQILLKILLFLKNNLKKRKSLSVKFIKGFIYNEMMETGRDFRNFCMRDKAEKVYRELEEKIGVC